ncbi:hypothetical protein AJ80_06624 [Polytolypa hystricis UAMH7299]|uniref:SCP domain-containing protein n=1 Tax=Polytolypa hystricis (strain UAMH7299) TaxID=1447883 RepID=A0A2B7XV75_POLH7|nr:hypothetical protein AJ80_06624 [Polytolypa hystricis UAMH7299]
MNYYLLLAAAFAALSHAQTTTITVLTPTGPPSASYTDNAEFQDDSLSVTNRYRSEHNARALSWNESLADSALDWADECLWKHSEVEGGPGENLAMGYPNVTMAVEAWGDERDIFDFDDPTFSKETGHFTQMVWKDTRTVGCGRKNCGRPGDGKDDGDDERAQGWYLVCHYWPPGNVVGGDQFETNVQAEGEGDGSEPDSSDALRVRVFGGWTAFGAAVLVWGYMFVAV